MTLAEKKAASMEIAQQTVDFHARGGKVEKVDHTANHSYQQPAKRTRKEQVKYRKRLSRIIM